jgi:hypothetical protein
MAGVSAAQTPLPNHSRRWADAPVQFELFYNQHRAHQGIANARPLRPLPQPITDPEQLAHLNIRRHDHLGGILHEYEHAA